ncbi:MAG TPA: amino acid permease [Thermoanaerobaculia bacterium]|nr:amino acid permease [Thermoanaerobaculia bacterium]
MRGIFQPKPLQAILASAEAPESALKRSLGPLQLTLLGIGAIIGAGIFSTVGTAAAGSADRLGAGPALVLSFVLTAVTCGFAALCYAEFASMVPISGSAYTYAYATLGELIGWIIGWDLILEYAVGNVAVAISWSGYFQELLRGFGMPLPDWLGTDLRSAVQSVHQIAEARAAHLDPATLGDAVGQGARALAQAPHVLGVPVVFNLPAFLIVMVVTVVLVIGIRESAWFNSSMVVLKLAIITFFVVFGAYYVKPANWRPFAPNGFAGISAAAAIIFFAYIGFDAVSTAAEETRNPKRDMPIAIISSLVVCTVIYIAVAVVLTGLLPWRQLGTAEPLATAFSGLGMRWPALLISLGAVFATTSVLVVFQLGQPRIFFSMARDGLLPQWAARVHPRFRTPHVTTWITGIAVGIFAGLLNINEVVDLTNIGTLFAFVLVCIGITVLRYKDPERPRPFRVPLGPWLLPGLGVVSCIFLMVYLPPASWWRFIGWLVLGMAIYFSYGYNQSRVGRGMGRPDRTPMTLQAAALGFLAIATGLFTIPHDASLPQLVAKASSAADPQHLRSLLGLALIGLGALASATGLLGEKAQRGG